MIGANWFKISLNLTQFFMNKGILAAAAVMTMVGGAPEAQGNYIDGGDANTIKRQFDEAAAKAICGSGGKFEEFFKEMDRGGKVCDSCATAVEGTAVVIGTEENSVRAQDGMGAGEGFGVPKIF